MLTIKDVKTFKQAIGMLRNEFTKQDYEQAVEYIKKTFPAHKTTIWIGAVDKEINPHSYIVPGLGDAGDLAYGVKE